jgi:sarcosine oxidase subunit gamma
VTATPHSPLRHLTDALERTGGAVRLRELPFRSQVELRVEWAPAGVGAFLGCELPGPGAVSAIGRRSVLWCGPGWYLVVDPPGSAAALEARLREALGETFGAVVDISAQRTTLELSGPRAREVLAHGCALDLHPRAFGPGRCAQTNLAQAQVILHQTAPDAYHVLVRASYADYLARWLLDAMTEYLAA